MLRRSPLYIRAQELITGLVFLAAGIAKLVGSGSQHTIWSGFRSDHPHLAACVIGLEILLALLLLVGRLSQPARAGAIVLLAAFLVVLARELVSVKPAASCGCFGQLTGDGTGSPRQNLMVTTGVDVVLLALTIIAFAACDRLRAGLLATKAGGVSPEAV